MFRSLEADKDAYITNRFADGVRAVSGNTGIAGSLDLFKLYGVTILTSGSSSFPQRELSRILVHFNIDPLKKLFEAGKIDITHSSFKCHLQLKDVYGGQVTPNNFSVEIFPLSASFEEGFGKDVSLYADKDKCNFISSSKENAWFLTGCGLACFATGSGDYITSSMSIANTKKTQIFKKGTEDLFVDVTDIVSATIKNEIPDQGYRISLSDSIENDNFTYFVKRFASRHAYDAEKRPKLIARFNDAIQDDSSNFYLDKTSNLFLYNYVDGQLTNISSASNPLTGSNCIILELKTEISGVGNYSLFFTGSQYSQGINFMSGVYSAPALISLTDGNIKNYFEASGSVAFTPVWKSLDGSLMYLTGSKLTAYGPNRTNQRLSPRRYTLNAIGINDEYFSDEEVTIRVNIFDENSPYIKAKRLPVELPGVVIKKAYFGIKNIATGEYAIPIDEENSSTLLSSDAKGMYFNFNTSALQKLNSYIVDIALKIDGMSHIYQNISVPFRIK
jgi:hypothetical protein